MLFEKDRQRIKNMKVNEEDLANKDLTSDQAYTREFTKFNKEFKNK